MSLPRSSSLLTLYFHSMANYTSTANVILSVNGKQAQKMLSQLEKDARRLEKQIAKAATAGDKATMKGLAAVQF